MLLRIDFSDETPIYMQIRNHIVSGIGSGLYKPGDKLPTIRTLANEAGINMMTVSKAYQVLKHEGYIYSNRRSGAVISSDLPTAIGIDPKIKTHLKHLLLEAKVQGSSLDDILAYCKEVFDSEGGK